MSHKTRIMASLKHLQDAQNATLNVLSGNTCPCMTSRQTGSYSEQWHRTNSSASDCEGTGLLSQITTTTNIRAVFYRIGLSGNVGVPRGFESLVPIGELQTGDLIVLGTLNTDSHVFITIDGYTDYNAYITYDGDDYFIRDVTDVGPYEIARLIKK